VSVDATVLLAEPTMSVGIAERVFATPMADARAGGSHFIAPVAGGSEAMLDLEIQDAAVPDVPQIDAFESNCTGASVLNGSGAAPWQAARGHKPRATARRGVTSATNDVG
jgi:hypothetical protein